MSRPAPLVSRRPQPNNAPVGGTSLGTPLKTRTVLAPTGSPAAAAAAGPATPQRARAAPSASPGASSSAAAARTPAKTPVRGFGSSVPSTVVPASSPPAASSASAAAAAAAPSGSPAAGKAMSRQRYDTHKTTNPFASGSSLKFKTPFSDAYVNGRIPCRINHGTVRHTLQWDRPSSELDLAFLLPVVAEGLRETEHPYVVIARQAFPLLLAEGGQARVGPLVSPLVQALRRGLMDPAPGVYGAACLALQQLSACVGPLLNAHLDLLLVQVAKKMMIKGTAKADADLSNDTVAALANHGGDEAVPIIKKRVPGFIM